MLKILTGTMEYFRNIINIFDNEVIKEKEC